MKVRVEVVCLNADGDEQRRQVLTIERRELAMETLGMNLSESKTLLACVQDFVVAQQVGVIAEFVPKRTLSSIEERGAGISQRPKPILERFGRPDVVAIKRRAGDSWGSSRILGLRSRAEVRIPAPEGVLPLLVEYARSYLQEEMRSTLSSRRVGLAR